MRLENALRWKRMWWFLSLNFLRDFFQELWLHVPATVLQEHLRKGIDLEKDLPTFGSDPRLKTYGMLTSLKDEFGVKLFGDLCTWQKFVFVQGGDDRVEEFVWGILASEMLERANALKLKEEHRSALQEFHRLSAMRQSELKKHLMEASKASFSGWDPKAISAEGETVESVSNLVNSICSSNIFASSWHEACTVRGSEFLEGLFKVSLRIASEDKSGRLIFSADTLPFPSSWEFDLEKSLNDIDTTSC